jgi:hypothetical protein
MRDLQRGMPAEADEIARRPLPAIEGLRLIR